MSNNNPFYLKEPFVYLLNPSLLPNDISIVKGFPVSQVLPEFYEKMAETYEDLDFRLLGNALSSAVKIHRSKIEITIKHHLKIEKREARKKNRELVIKTDRNLPVYWTRPKMTLTPENERAMFFEELMLLFEQEFDEEEKIVSKPKKQENLAPRKRRKLTADGIGTFEYAMNFNLTDIEELVEDIFTIIKQYFNRRTEVEFTTVMEYHILQLGLIDEERIQIERVRVLLSLLYLIQDTRVEAWEEEETFEIFITIPEEWQSEKIN